ncbi:MAG: DUF460 domain-containing protein [Acidilobaceae archaeon]
MSSAGYEAKCMGVDLESGSPGGRDARYHIMVVESSGHVIYKAESVSLAKLIRLAWEYRPEKIGFDNIYELGEDERSLIRILSLLPPKTSVVQVTLVDGQFLDVREVARRAGVLSDYSKLDPSKTAYINAVLSCMGYGSNIRSVEEKTLIQVSKLRSHSPGGWSQQRYQRRIRAAIYNVANSIKEALDRASLDYDYYYRESKGGLESAVFTVYAPREAVEGIVSEYEGQDYTVKIKPVYRSKLLVTVKQHIKASKPIIVGIDAGTTTGIAIVDLDCRVLYISSSKNLDRGSIIDTILRYGKPVAIATDVSDPPETIRKLASQVGAALYTPPYDLSVAEKRELVERIIGESIRDSHERDALAAAIKAYSSIKTKLDQIDKKLEGLSEEINREDVKKWVISGLTIAEALERVIEGLLEHEGAKPRVVEEKIDKHKQVDVSAYIVELERLRAQKEILESKIKNLESAIREYERRLREIQYNIRIEVLRDNEVVKLQSRIKDLESYIESMRSTISRLEDTSRRLVDVISRVAKGDVIIARRIPVLNITSLKKSERILGELRSKEVIVVENPGIFEDKALQYIKNTGITAILTNNLDSPLANTLKLYEIPVLNIKDYLVEDIQDIEVSIIKSSIIDDAKRELEKLKSLRKPPDIERIIEEYRAQRREELSKSMRVSGIK